jgi:hypothetical protein
LSPSQALHDCWREGESFASEVLEVIREDSVMGRVELIRKHQVGGGKWIGVDCHSDVPGDWG